MMRKQLALFCKTMKEIRDSARELLPKEMPALTEELFGLYETTGNRLKYEEVYFARRKMLAVLGMRAILGLEEQWEEKQTYIQKLEEVILDICREETWALPAHVNRRENPQWRITVDLFASETAQTLSELMEFWERQSLPRCGVRCGRILRKEYSSLILHRKCPISISHGSAGQITGTRYAPEVSAAPACI